MVSGACFVLALGFFCFDSVKNKKRGARFIFLSFDILHICALSREGEKTLKTQTTLEDFINRGVRVTPRGA
jgi:hypothetical protein